jgi:hypothetical protein
MRAPLLESRRPLSAALLAIALLAAAAPPAGADVGETIIQRCTHGQSLAGFSQRDYRRALKELSADAEEYTDCGQLIRQAQLAAAAGRGGGAAPVALTTSPSEQRAIAHAARSGSAPVKIGDRVVHPGVVHANIASAFSKLPTPLIALTAFLVACLLAFVGGVLRDRIRARRAS